MTTGANYGELCCHFIRNGLKLLNWPPLLNSEGEANVDNSTFLAATPGTFVRARTRKVKSEREKALSELREGEREGGKERTNVDNRKKLRADRNAAATAAAGMLLPAAAHSDQGRKEGLDVR